MNCKNSPDTITATFSILCLLLALCLSAISPGHRCRIWSLQSSKPYFQCVFGAGVEVTNIQFNGDPRAVGYFSGGTTSIGIERGIVLTSGFASEVEEDGVFFADNTNIGGSVEASLEPIATDAQRCGSLYHHLHSECRYVAVSLQFWFRGISRVRLQPF
ncbi:MAG: choice-of-anchor L domain-containing protein [Lewinellaceae bacterium]|nr:choice-of-anchor L domain-containing protein [Lewinellaceae bacterium]